MPPTFADLGVPADLTARLAARGIVEAFPIQAAALPDALAGRDVVGQAVTGSGKTLAFGLALLARLTPARAHRPRALVLTPTRELAAQVQRELAALVRDPRRVLSVYGGTPYGAARKALAHGVDIVVACPGRLEDLLAQGTLSLGEVVTVVVDEADRMADMGFLPAVRRILGQVAPHHQTMLFSATMGPDVASLVSNFTVDAARHDVVGPIAEVPVDHHFVSVAHAERVEATVRLLDEHERAIVFTRTKHGADRLARQLNDRGVSAAALHGGRSQGQRDRALGALSAGRVRALVATDVAARGIHVEALPAVVHFDPPTQSADYVHRSGRTGRAGAPGVVVSLVTPETSAHVRQIQRTLGLGAGASAPSAPAATGATRPVRATPAPARVERREAPARPRRERGAHRAIDASPAASVAGEAVVTNYNGARGYGFATDGSGDDLFVHRSQIAGTGQRALARGQRIRFDEATGPRGREARNVRLVGARGGRD
ncbi:MAG: DEAD/DEAH box helicase [Acidimicrobiales bacterium]